LTWRIQKDGPMRAVGKGGDRLGDVQWASRGPVELGTPGLIGTSPILAAGSALDPLEGIGINLYRLDLPSLRLVVECARTGSLSAAAPACHMSVSGASHKLARLEDGLGTALFRRHHRGLALTEAGQRVAETSRAVLGTLESMIRVLKG
jgi:hypothetical protein